MAPPGTRVVVHDRHPASWAFSGLDWFYVGPVLEGYRTFRVYITSTQHERSSDTLSWYFNILETKSNFPSTHLSASVTG